MDASGLKDTREFSGCQGVEIVRHQDDPTRFLFIERWDSEQDYRNYIAWRTEGGQFQALQAMAVSLDVNIWPQTVLTV